MDYPRFTSEEVSRAAGIPPATLANWIKRLGHSMISADTDFQSAADRIATGTGRSRLFTRRTALRIAITAQVAKIGLPLEFAVDCSVMFADLSGGLPRLPGELLAPELGNGTALLITFLPGAAPKAEISTLDHALSQVCAMRTVAIISLDALVHDVDRSLQNDAGQKARHNKTAAGMLTGAS